MTLYDIRLIVPDATEFDDMAPALQNQLESMDARWPSFPGIGTVSNGGKKLIHARLRYPNLTKQALEGMFTAFGLDWQVVGIREAAIISAVYDDDGIETQAAYYPVIEQIDKVVILPYLENISEGINTTRVVEMTDTVILPMYAGTEPMVIV